MSARFATTSVDLGVTQQSWQASRVADTIGKVVGKLLEGIGGPESFDGRVITIRLTKDGYKPNVIITATEG